MARNTPLDRYKQHCGRVLGKFDRLGNPIEMRLTFEEWWKIWQDSGKWGERGRKRGSYVMSRVDDLGSYEVGNVFIQLHGDNVSQWCKGKSISKAHRDAVSRARLGTTHSAESKAKMSAAHKGRTNSPETREKLSKALTGRVFTPEWIAKQKATKLARGCLQKPCTIDGIKIYPSRKAMWAELGRGKRSDGHPNFRYLNI